MDETKKISLFEKHPWHGHHKFEDKQRILFYMKTVMYYLNRIQENLSYHDSLYYEKTHLNMIIGGLHSTQTELEKNYDKQKKLIDVMCERCNNMTTKHPDNPKSFCPICAWDIHFEQCGLQATKDGFTKGENKP